MLAKALFVIAEGLYSVSRFRCNEDNINSSLLMGSKEQYEKGHSESELPTGYLGCIMIQNNCQ